MTRRNRRLSSDAIARLDEAGDAAGSNQHAPVVDVLTEHARSMTTAETFGRAASLSADLGDGRLMDVSWRQGPGSCPMDTT